MDVGKLLSEHFRHEPTTQQTVSFELLGKFIMAREGKPCFLLKGYAGTGKTTLISTLVKVLPKLKMKYVLLAPTGRAAKVISNYTGQKAFTVHKRIYRKKNAATPDMVFALSPNIAANTIFIVDEASMIPDHSAEFGQRSLLQDLVEYVYNLQNCKLMLVGDTAQLPPVGADTSPAFDHQALADRFDLDVTVHELTEVVRQEKESGILHNATGIRELVRLNKLFYPKMNLKGFKDIYRMTGERLEEGLSYAYSKYGMENTLVICRSNKNANAYNQNVRNRLLYREEELTGGDYLMVVRNNYFWLQKEDAANAFIANGDIAKVKKVKGIEDMHGFRFASVVLEMIDYPDDEPLECKVMLDTLYVDSPNLNHVESNRLYQSVLQDYAHIKDKRKQHQELKSDPYYNALQVKFAYAVTCHKAQGGQWDAVFIDQGYLTAEMLNVEFLRWLYTALTRGVKEVFLVNFSEKFFES